MEDAGRAEAQLEGLPPPPRRRRLPGARPGWARDRATRRRARSHLLLLLAALLGVGEIAFGVAQIARVVRAERDIHTGFGAGRTGVIRDLDGAAVRVTLTGVFGDQFAPNSGAGSKQVVVDAIVKTTGGVAAPDGRWTLHTASDAAYPGAVTATRDMAGQEYFIVTFTVPQDVTVKRLTYDPRLASHRLLVFDGA